MCIDLDGKTLHVVSSRGTPRSDPDGTRSNSGGGMGAPHGGMNNPHENQTGATMGQARRRVSQFTHKYIPKPPNYLLPAILSGN